MLKQIFRGALLAASFAALVACSDNISNPTPQPGNTATVIIRAVDGIVYENDNVALNASVKDSVGADVPGARIVWGVSDTTVALIDGDGVLSALKAGTITVSAKSGAASATRALTIVRPPVTAVVVHLAAATISRGDVIVQGVRTDGPSGRVIVGRTVALSSSNPSVAVVDPSGRIRAVAPGVASIRATVEGVQGSAQLTVTDTDAVLHLSRYNGQTLPALVAVDTVDVNGKPEIREIYAESGTLTLSGINQPRYKIAMKYVEYALFVTNGQRRLEYRGDQGEGDRGIVEYDARGDLKLLSEFYSPLSHTMTPLSGGMQAHYRIPGTNDYLALMFRREPL